MTFLFGFFLMDPCSTNPSVPIVPSSLLSKKVMIDRGLRMKVTYTDKSGEKVELKFNTEDEGKKLKEKLKAQGITEARWEW
jgi:hypothetical protein